MPGTPTSQTSFPGCALHKTRTILLGVPLRLKILGLALTLIFLCGAITIYKVNGALNENVETFLREESRFVATELSYQTHDYLLINDIYGLTQMLKNTVKNRPDLRYVIIGNDTGQVVTHTFDGGFPSDLLDKDATLLPRPASIALFKTNEGDIWEARAAIGNNNEGLVVVGVKGDLLRHQAKEVVWSLAGTIMLIAFLGTVISLWLSRVITQPVNRLLAAMQVVRRGDYSVILNPTTCKDELGKLIEGFNEMTQALGKADHSRLEKEQLQRNFLQRVMAGQEGERKRIARELHDQTSQALASFMIDLKFLEKATEPTEIHQGITRMKKAITVEMEALHDLAVALRPSVLDDLGLEPALKMLISKLNDRQDMHASLTLIGFDNKRPDACPETCVYRIIQESLVNVIKHAGATEVTVLLEWRGDKLRGVIEDNGIGFEPDLVDKKSRLGVMGMQERAQLLQGICNIESSPDHGTMVSFEIPSQVMVCHES